MGLKQKIFQIYVKNNDNIFISSVLGNLHGIHDSEKSNPDRQYVPIGEFT